MSPTQRNTPVPLNDPRRGALAIQAELSARFERFLVSGRYVLGGEVEAFEREFASFLGVRHCVGVASGTDALELALLAVGCKPGDVVVSAANCGGYAASAARNVGLSVRYADVDPGTLTLTAPAVEAVLSRDVRAVVVTHLYGLLSDLEPIVELCRQRGIALVEDCAHAAGARRNGRRAGSYGDVAAFSFYPTKNLPALGDGGAVVTSEDAVAERVLRLRQHGWAAKYEITMPGGRNSRLDELQAAVLRIRLDDLDDANAARRRIVQRYADALASGAGRFVMSGGEEFAAHLAVLVVEDRAGARAAFEAAGVATDVHYPIPDHRQPAWHDDYASVHLPVSEHAVEHVFTVPCFPELRDEETATICDVLSGL